MNCETVKYFFAQSTTSTKMLVYTNHLEKKGHTSVRSELFASSDKLSESDVNGVIFQMVTLAKSLVHKFNSAPNPINQTSN